MKRLNGSITIYFTFAIVLIISVIMSVTEIARVNCQKLYLQIATDSALDSMASLYHRNLYEYYSLYGVEYRTKEMLETEYLSYMMPYFSDGDADIKNWYIAKTDEENIDLNYKVLTDENNFEKEIINYMKYKLIGKAIEFLGDKIVLSDEGDIEKLAEDAENLFEELDKGSIYSEVYERYFDFADDIRILENYAKGISDYIDKINIKINGIKTMSVSGSLSNGNATIKKFEALISDINFLRQVLNSYRNKMNLGIK